MSNANPTNDELCIASITRISYINECQEYTLCPNVRYPGTARFPGIFCTLRKELFLIAIVTHKELPIFISILQILGLVFTILLHKGIIKKQNNWLNNSHGRRYRWWRNLLRMIQIQITVWIAIESRRMHLLCARSSFTTCRRTWKWAFWSGSGKKWRNCIYEWKSDLYKTWSDLSWRSRTDSWILCKDINHRFAWLYALFQLWAVFYVQWRNGLGEIRPISIRCKQ